MLGPKPTQFSVLCLLSTFSAAFVHLVLTLGIKAPRLNDIVSAILRLHSLSVGIM
jgi:hypothetical protein